jgi:hypothetical protein
MMLLNTRPILWRDEHFIAGIVFLSKRTIYHCFYFSVRKMSECFSH